ncbi:hypothetical protein OKW30_003556 [Paraburkholderia sp. Clong3]|uniref:hypothetical protein n=1 Tax=Paraburkholderia sp. Clong3 TaxID=2991061 RepID=UPI003D256DB5
MEPEFKKSELELRQRADEVLYYVWDPIGVAECTAARDEYERYLPKVLSLLQQGANASAIAAYLDALVTDQMGLQENTEHSKRVAELVLNWKTRIYRSR